MNRRHLVGAALWASVLSVAPSLSWAQAYPSKPITVIVPFAPGGGSDNIARLFTARLSERTGKTFIIDNRAGGATNIGNEAAARAVPDGHTLLLGQFTLSVNASLFTKLRYDPAKDFVPVAHVATAPTVLVVKNDSKVRDVKSLIAAAKAAPDQLNYASGGIGTSVHLAGALFESMADVKMQHVAYKGSAPAMTDLIGGQVEMMFDTASSALPHLKGGRIRALAVTGSQRLAELPNVPTFSEQGMPAFDVPVWYGFVAPAGTPPAAVQWLNTEINAVLKEPAVNAQLEKIGAVPVGGTPAQMGEFMKTQATRWAKVIKDAGIQPE